MSLVEPLIEFLGSFKNAEGLSSELRSELTVPTTLDTLLLRAASEQRTVFITGAAGSGKTHLLRSLKLPRGVELVGPDGQSRRQHILVVPDATELAPDERVRLVNKTGSTRLASIVAINEGPLRETARIAGGDIYKEAADLLHSGQRGIVGEYDPDLPTVVDMGAFDPLAQEVLAPILNLPLLRAAIEERRCGCPADVCPRLLAWRQFESETVRQRVAKLARMVLLGETNWAFRDVWDFVADLVLGGDCSDDPPSSPWFWRMFYGSSRLSAALRDICDPEAVALPAIDQHLWYGDWASSRLSTVDSVEFQTISRPDEPSRIARFLWLRAQTLLLTADDTAHGLLYLSLQHRLQRAARDRILAPILEAINSYMTYDLLQPSHARLQLWVDHSVERRTDRARGQVLAGVVDASELAIRPSQVVINHPDLQTPVYGAHRFLVHPSAGAALELTPEKLALFESKRSFRRADRRHTDLEFDLLRFFAAILAHLPPANEIGFLVCDEQRASGDVQMYTVSRTTTTLEER